ncbi:hypothetical protein AGMMS49592_0420 [Endomicrobiia bacterium]|nr:hypothetical protein AGMMS49592_0420 [Endomicrobiia bacterium]
MWYTFDGRCFSKAQAKSFRKTKERKLAIMKQKLGYSYELMPQDLLYWKEEKRVKKVKLVRKTGYIFDEDAGGETNNYRTGYEDDVPSIKHYIAQEKEKKEKKETTLEWKRRNIRELKWERTRKFIEEVEHASIPKEIINMKEKTEHALATIDNWESLTDRALIKKLALHGIQEALRDEGLTFHKALGLAMKEMLKDKNTPWYVKCKTLIYAADKLGLPEEDTSRNNVVVLAGMSQQDIDAEKVVEIHEK